MFKTTGRLTISILFFGLLVVPFLTSAAFAEDKPAASVVIPYFEASANPAGKTTLFSLTNAGADPAIVHVTLWTGYWQPTVTFDVVLGGHDIATYNVRDILNGNLPATDPRGLPGCTSYPAPAFGDTQRQILWQDHQGTTCIAEDTNDVAVGIITADVVRQCSGLVTNAYNGSGETPLSAGYFANNGGGLALNTNVLLSDFHLVDPIENYAQGDTAFHLQASSTDHPAGGATFYSGLGSAGADNRAPLSNVLYGRVINGGAFTGGTELIVLRQPQQLRSWNQLQCGQSPWSEAENAVDMMVLDESGNGFLSQRPLTAGVQKINLKGWPELPTFGALTLRAAGGEQMAGLVLHNASGRFGTGFKAQNLGGDAGDGGIETLANAFNVDFTHEVNGQAASFVGACYNGSSPSASCVVVNWFFGDGASGGPLSTSHIYPAAGTYAVTLVARDESGHRAARTHLVTIEDDGGGGGGGGGAFSVAFSSLQTPGTLSVAFQGSCFLDGVAVACLSPDWDFGDGGVAGILAPTHLYLAAGTYPVTFTASAAGQTDSVTVDVTVEAAGNPGNNFDVSFTALQVPGTLGVQYVGTCFLSGVIVACENPHFSFGDGGTADAVSVLHTYAAAGTYPVSFTAAHGNQTDTAARDITVTAVVPPNNFTVHFTALQLPGTLEVQFVGTCFDGVLPVVCENGQWAFGDGGTGTGTTVQHEYAAAGTYAVTFTASFGSLSDSETTNVPVAPVIVTPFAVNFTFLQTPGSLTVQFTGACFADALPVPCENPQWTFGDSTSGNGASVSHTYPAAGTYSVVFTASHGGQTDSATAEIEVLPVAPPVVFDVSFTHVQTPATLTVQYVGACFENALPVTCENPTWSFGDGGTGSGASVSHTYGAAGTFTVTFTASHGGQTDTATASVTVLPIPVVQFDVSFSYVQTPNTLTVQFTGSCFANSLPVACQNPTWIFGDGSTGNGGTVSHTYASLGIYNVTFTASSGTQTDSQTTIIEVVGVNSPPLISSLVCTPNPIIGGLVSLCLLVVADLDGDELTYQVDLLSGLVCLQETQGGPCLTSITGHVAGGIGIQIPFFLATNLAQATTASIRAIITDSHGHTSLPILTEVQVLLNHPPVVSLFTCVPPVVVGGVPALCSFNLVDLDPGNLSWTVEIVSGANACLGDGPGCAQTLTGVTNGLLTTINFGLRTSGTTTSPVRLRATANDGLQTHQMDISVIVL